KKCLGVGILVTSLLVIAGSALGQQQSSRKAKEQFVGTWKLVAYEVGASLPMGRDSVGLLTYGADGRMSLQVMRFDRPKFLASGGKEGGYESGTAEEVMSAYRGYIAYFGTYEVSEEGRFVTHHIEGSLFPNWVGRGQIEFFELSGDQLTFGVDPIRYIWKRRK
ncbi:MAG: lipocalin-like domain-containing protein, partial [candidate division NC10 bacterium]